MTYIEISSKACLLYFPLGNAVLEWLRKNFTCSLSHLPFFPSKSQPRPSSCRQPPPHAGPIIPFSFVQNSIAYKPQLHFLMAPRPPHVLLEFWRFSILKNKLVNKIQPFSLSAYHLTSKKYELLQGRVYVLDTSWPQCSDFRRPPNRSLIKGINGNKSTKECFSSI